MGSGIFWNPPQKKKEAQLQGTYIDIPPWGEKGESSTQKCHQGGGYVSFSEGLTLRPLKTSRLPQKKESRMV